MRDAQVVGPGAHQRREPRIRKRHRTPKGVPGCGVESHQLLEVTPAAPRTDEEVRGARIAVHRWRVHHVVRGGAHQREVAVGRKRHRRAEQISGGGVRRLELMLERPVAPAVAHVHRRRATVRPASGVVPVGTHDRRVPGVRDRHRGAEEIARRRVRGQQLRAARLRPRPTRRQQPPCQDQHPHHTERKRNPARLPALCPEPSRDRTNRSHHGRASRIDPSMRRERPGAHPMIRGWDLAPAARRTARRGERCAPGRVHEPATRVTGLHLTS